MRAALMLPILALAGGAAIAPAADRAQHGVTIHYGNNDSLSPATAPEDEVETGVALDPGYRGTTLYQRKYLVDGRMIDGSALPRPPYDVVYAGYRAAYLRPRDER